MERKSSPLDMARKFQSKFTVADPLRPVIRFPFVIMEGLQNTIMRNRMTFCKRRVCRASAKDELQTIGRPPSQLGGAGRSADCSQLYALQFYTARCKHSALRAPCSQRFTPESGALRPTLMPEASYFFTLIGGQNNLRQSSECQILLPIIRLVPGPIPMELGK